MSGYACPSIAAIHERGNPARAKTIVGLVTLANLVGAALGLILTLLLIEQMSIPSVQLIYGALTAISAIAFIALARERPPTPPCPPELAARALMLDGLKHALTVRSFWLYLLVSFIGLLNVLLGASPRTLDPRFSRLLLLCGPRRRHAPRPGSASLVDLSGALRPAPW